MVKKIHRKMCKNIFNQMNQEIKEGKLTKGWVTIEKCIQFIRQNYMNPDLDIAMIGLTYRLFS